MGVNIEYVLSEINFDQKLITVFNTYTKYINFRFDYIIRRSLSQIPDELNHNVDYSEFDPNEEILLACINDSNNVNNVTKLREELKTLVAEVNTKRKEVNIIAVNEDGLRKNIKHLEDIISIKENFIRETATYADIRCNAKEKVIKEYQRTTKKYSKILSQLNKTNKAMKLSSNIGNTKQTEYLDRLNERVLRYEGKIKRMDDIIQIASDSKEKLLQYQMTLQTSKDRLLIFYDQLNGYLKRQQVLTTFIAEKEKRIYQLKLSLSNLGVLSSVERSREHTSSNLIEADNLKKEFLELQHIRNEVLSFRPRGMFNPKYQKENSSTKAEVRKYLENDEVIDSIDYLIELKNNDVHNSHTNLLHYIRSNSNEATIFLKCLSTLSLDELKKLLLHYFIKVVDLKESGRENDELIAKLDEISDKQKHSIVSLNNDYQEFHLSIEKKCMALKKHYQSKLNTLFELVQEDNNAITVFKMRQEITLLKKKIIELEKSQTTKPAKPKESLLTPQRPEPLLHKSKDKLDESKSGSETMSSAKVTYHKNKLKIQKNKSKLT